MEKKTVSGIMLVLLIIGLLSLAFNIQPAKSEWTGTVYIRADGSIDPPDAPIITHDNITYTLTDNITSSGDGIVVERNNIIIDGNRYTLQGSKSGHGIHLFSISNVTIKNTNIRDFYSTTPFVYYYGIYLYESSNNKIFENNLVNNDASIHLDFSSNNKIFKNEISASNLYGIELYCSSNNNSIFENNITKSWLAGIWLESSSNNKVFRNNVADNHDGMVLKDSVDNNVFENNITANNCYGIFLWLSLSNNVFGNNITDNNKEMSGTGVDIERSSYNNLYQNNVADNAWGIYFCHSPNNRLTGNSITNNYHGIYFDSSSLNNSVYHNNFVNNPNQAYSECINVWDDGYPSGGNYWSDYADVDLYTGPYQNLTEGIGSDGIGDMPYIIDANDTDHYPLMIPWTNENPIYPLEGQYANYTIRLIETYDSIGPEQTMWNLTYHKYVSPFLIYVMSWTNYPTPNWDWSALNITNRYARHFTWPITGRIGDMWFPGWIKTKITLGSTVKLLNNTATVVDNKTLRIKSTLVDCWELSYLEYLGDVQIQYTFWYDKLTGLLIGGEAVGDSTKVNLTLTDTNIILSIWDSQPPIIGIPSHIPEEVLPDQEVKVVVAITDNLSGVKNVTLLYTTNNGTTWENRTMNYNVSTDLYEATIPPQKTGTWVSFKIIAYDYAGNNATEDNNGYFYKYHVIPEFQSSVALLGFLVLITIPLVFAKKKQHSRKANNKPNFPSFYDES